MKFLKENWSAMLTALFLFVVGILLLVNPGLFAVVVIKVSGILLAIIGIVDVVKYFRASPEEAAKGSAFYSGAIMITAGMLCLFGGTWFVEVFPVLAVLYGVFQILLGFRKLQRTVDALRLKNELWWLKGISACMSLCFGFIITLIPGMTLMSIWIFTGITMIFEGVFDAVSIAMMYKKTSNGQ
ncbi:MAG: DUF308 domain-containing protein [Clostridia bacterium]|nr:DUF308 domain-containing protein [Clostridia bacterium]